MIDRDRLVNTFCELARIDSPSGEEEQVAQYLVGQLEALGLDVARDGYGNVIATDGRDDPIMLSAHMDTVEPGRGVEPIVEGDRIRTNETTILGGDCKAGVAAILEAIESIKDDDTPHVPYQVAFTREEEIGLHDAGQGEPGGGRAGPGAGALVRGLDRPRLEGERGRGRIGGEMRELDP